MLVLSVFRVILMLVLFTAVMSDEAQDHNMTFSQDFNDGGYFPGNHALLNKFIQENRLLVSSNLTISNDINVFDYIEIWDKLSYLPYNIKQNEAMAVINLISNLLPISHDPSGVHRGFIYSNFHYYLNNLNITRFENGDWIIRVFHPFYDNVTGIAVYEDNGTRRIESIYRNETELDVTLNNLQLAAFIPEELLQTLREAKTKEELQNFTVRMVMILEGRKFEDLWNLQGVNIKHFVGVSMPGYCKVKHITFVKVYIKNDATNNLKNWEEIGKEYVDYPPKYLRELCILSQMVFIGRLGEEELFDSAIDDQCFDTREGIMWPTFSLTTIYRVKLSYPFELCIDYEYHLFIDFCNETSAVPIQRPISCRNDTAYNNQTKLNYEKLLYCVKCRERSYCNESFYQIINEATSYFDFIIARSFLYVPFYNRLTLGHLFKNKFDVASKAFSFLENRTEEFKISKMVPLLSTMREVSLTYKLTASRKITYLTWNLIFSEIVGFKIYKNSSSIYGYDVELLTDHNATLNDSSDNNVNVIAYITKSNVSFGFCWLVVIYGSFTEYRNESSISDLVAIYCDFGNPILNVFLRTKEYGKQGRKEYYLNEGYSITIPVTLFTCNIFYIYEYKDSICDPVSKLGVFQQNLENYTTTKHFGKKTMRSVDLLSHIVVSISENVEEDQQHITIQQVITYLLSSLSLFGTFSVLLSAAVLKDWYKLRMYSIQMTISVTGETIFFLISESYITQIGYILFYYFLLSQFTWMLIISYIQYIRFVKIFESFELNVFRTSVFGWISPIAITLISVLTHLQCLQCNFCSKNRQILMNFIIIPICIIIVINTIIYGYVMVKISRSGTQYFTADAQKAKRWASRILPFMLGISWIFLIMLFIPSPTVALIVSYVLHIVASSQGLVLFVFVIVLDKGTKMEWYRLCCCIKKCNRNTD